MNSCLREDSQIFEILLYVHVYNYLKMLTNVLWVLTNLVIVCHLLIFLSNKIEIRIVDYS